MIPEGCSNDALVMPRSPARCQTCGAELGDTAEWFCGGDRCLRVFWPDACAIGRAQRCLSLRGL
jgi:hypothetical protein